MNETKLSNAENIFLEDALRATAEKYEKLRLQRLNAVKTWNAKNRAKANEYSRKYQAKLYAEKKANKQPNEKIQQYNNPEEYKRYQKEYRENKKLKVFPLKALPFFNDTIA